MNVDGLPLRIASRIRIQADGCWAWTGATNWGGYGLVQGDGRLRAAHRYVYELLVGPIPEGLTLDHMCHDPETCLRGTQCPHRACVNPAHLEPATVRANTLRGNSRSAVNARKTHCPKGHTYSGVNSKGERVCIECDRDRRAARSPEQIAEDRRKGRERVARRRATPEGRAAINAAQRRWRQNQTG